MKTRKLFTACFFILILIAQGATAFEMKNAPKTTVLGITIKSSLKSLTDDAKNLPAELMAKAQELKLEITGSQIWVYEGSDGNPETQFTVTIAVPVAKKSGDPGKFSFIELPEFKCVSEIHKGPYNKLGETYQKLIPEIMQKGLALTGISREIYNVVDFEHQENCVTEIQIGIR